MLESFPAPADTGNLTAVDFYRFSASFAEVLQQYIPSGRDVTFATSLELAEKRCPAIASLSEAKSLFSQVKDGILAFATCPDFLLLPFRVKDGDKIVAIIQGADPLFLQKVSEDWLLDTRIKAEREFLLIKQARIDCQTGLLNITNLYSLLDRFGADEGIQLILLELASTRNSFKDGMRNAQKCASLLVDFMPQGAMIHALGHAAFALVLQYDIAGKRPEIEQALVNYLKKEGCSRVHIGSSLAKGGSEKSDQKDQPGRQLLDEAWTALRHAARRGPYSFCDFGQLAHPENHPLTPPLKNLSQKLSRLWASSGCFCLVQFRSDNDSCTAAAVIPPHVTRGQIVMDEENVYVFLDGQKADDALAWARQIIRLVDDQQENIHISAGVSSYPYCGFKKSEMIMNCRKALLHGAFYGDSSAVVFDAVSLNVSGDIYFGDGDMAKAVKEYQRGLQCDNQDVNLHNSLGVALAMMNKLSPALASFKRGLALDGNNFMALYNLGLGEQARKRKTEALGYLEKALECSGQEEDGEELVKDLRLQLGILSCELGKYGATLEYLVPWFSENQNLPSAGRVHYYLGEAYYGLDDRRNAMAALQRALRFNEMDDRAMNLLGRVYLEEGEGDQIALSLCRKSIEIEPGNILYKLALAEVLLACGRFAEARENLSRCLKNSACKVQAQLLMSRCYRHEGQNRRARVWIMKLLAQKKLSRKDKHLAEQELQSINDSLKV